MTSNQILEPPHRVCGICNDDGKCLANENHPDYEFDPDDGLTYLDCWNYIRKRDAELKKTAIRTVKDLIDEKIEMYDNDNLFYHIQANATVRELIAYLTKNNIQACAVVNSISDDGTSIRVLGEIGWDEITRNISNILDDQVNKHKSEPAHSMPDSRSLLDVKSAFKKKRLFCITNKERKYYATITSDDLLNYYESIITPFHLLREIEVLIRVILDNYDVTLDEKAPFGDFVKSLLKPEVFDNLPYEFPKDELADLLSKAVIQRNLFFHHRTERTEVGELEELWKELKSIFEELNKK